MRMIYTFKFTSLIASFKTLYVDMRVNSLKGKRENGTGWHRISNFFEIENTPRRAKKAVSFWLAKAERTIKRLKHSTLHNNMNVRFLKSYTIGGKRTSSVQSLLLFIKSCKLLVLSHCKSVLLAIRRHYPINS